jgi:hypothetical protein
MSILLAPIAPKAPSFDVRLGGPRRYPLKAKRLHFTREVDLDGAKIVRVAIANSPKGETARLLEIDFDWLVSEGYGHGWYLMGNGKGRRYVRVNLGGGTKPGTARTIANILMAPPRGKQVRFIDKNPLNLRRDNLTYQDKPIERGTAI